MNNIVCETENINLNEQQKSKKSFFTLTRKNQKGQVAIFVALIFQIVFIFFALLINVGLLVHHKINLQQSTDLAAYYGATKQAEMLNVISHVNFQIRQAWKLLTWRYRILGTFGMVAQSPNAIRLPIEKIIGPTLFSNVDTKCPTSGFNLNDVPAFCLAHIGFGDWSGGARGETFCKASCTQLDTGVSNVIPSISTVGSFSVTGANVGAAVAGAIASANANLADICKNSTRISANMLAQFLNSYGLDAAKKKLAISALFANLNSESPKFIDLNGDLVEKGSKNTFLNNLTEANRSSVGSTFKTLNGSSDDFSAGADCKTQMYSEILFQYIAFYQLACSNPANVNNFQFVNTVMPDGSLNGVISFQVTNPTEIHNSFIQKFSIGIEKNPWCMVYYGARAQSEPKIPFLPISVIKLNAVSFAKPFGGSTGPWFFKNWQSGIDVSARDSGNAADQVDKSLPLRKVVGAAATQASAKNVIMNYANFVGDDLGLARVNYIGRYHDLLMGGSKIGDGKSDLKFANWSNITNGTDFLSTSPRIKNLEMSVVAPNQFDLTYYSIEPDFYNNYYKGRMESGSKFVLALKNNTGINASFATDYGDVGATVMNQIQIAKQTEGLPAPSGAPNNFPFIPTSPASLLTGWTFLNLTDVNGYKDFPFDSGAVGRVGLQTKGSMLFGTCNDSADVNKDYKTLADPTASPPRPPTPGNCVTGGRTGYSVKIVSQEAINGLQGPIGGDGTSGEIKNKIPPSFLNF